MIALQNGNILVWKVSYIIVKLSYTELLVFNNKIRRHFLKKRKKKREKAEAAMDTAKPLLSFVKSNTQASFPPQNQHKYLFRLLNGFWQFPPYILMAI